MKILGIDTTTKFLSVGIYDSGRICEYNIKLGTLQSSLLEPAIKRIIRVLKWRIEDIDYFACGLGPGSFTGIRVGVSFIKGLGWSLNKPIIGIPTLDILARNAVEFGGIIIPLVDAKRSLIYCSAYQNQYGSLKKIMTDSLLTKEELFKRMRSARSKVTVTKNVTVTLLGDALTLYKDDLLRNIKNSNPLELDYWYPEGRNIIQLALERIKAKKINSAFNIKPIYLYPDDCQIKK